MADFPQVGLEAVLLTAAFEKGGKIVGDVLDKTTDQLEETEDSSAGAGGALDALGGIASGVATGGLTVLLGTVTAVAGALVGLATDGFKWAAEFGGAMSLVQAQTGATDAEMAKFRKTAESVFVTGLGESFEDVAQAMAQVERTTGAADEQLEAMTADALAMSEVFDVDVSESVRAVDQAMIAFGTEGTRVFDLMTRTMQETGDPMDDLADTINEYSTNFAEAGFSAEQMFNVLTSGLEAGAWNFDKVGDTAREFFIRLKDGSDTTAEALTGLGLPVEKFLSDLTDGTITGADAMSTIIQKLKEIEDPIQRNQLGVALFGSMWEDMGESVILALDPAIDKLGEVEGATQKAGETVHSGLGAAWEELKRTLQVSVASGFEPVLATIVEKVTPAFQAFADWLAGPGRDVLDEFGRVLSDNLGVALEGLGPFIEDKVIPALTEFANWLKNDGIPKLQEFIDWVVNEAIPALSGLGDAFETINKVMKVLKIAETVTDPIKLSQKVMEESSKTTEKKLIPAFEDLGETINKETIPAIKNFIGELDKQFKKIKKDAEPSLAALYEIIEDTWSDIEDFIDATLKTIQDNIEDVWSDIEDFIDSTMGAIQDIIESVWNAIEDFIDSIMDAIQNIIETAWKAIENFIDSTMDAIQDIIESVWTAIKNFIDNTMDAIQSIIESVWTAIKNFIDSTMDAIQSIIESVWTAIKNFIDTTMDAIQNIIETAWNAIKNFIDTTLDAIQNIIESVWNAIRDTIEQVMDSIQNAIEQGWNAIRDTIENTLSQIASEIESRWNEFLSTISAVLSDIVEEVRARFQDVYDTVRERLLALAEIPNEIAATLISIGTAIIERILEGIRGVTTFVSDVIEQLRTWFESVGSSITSSFAEAREVGAALIDKVITGIQNWVSGGLYFAGWVVDWLKTQFGNIVSGAAQGVESLWNKVKEIGTDIVDWIVNGIKSMAGAVWSALVDIVNDAIERLFGVRPFAENAGRNMAAGIAQGIYDGSNWVSEAATWAVTNALNAAQAAAGAHSPSALFATLGHDLMTGLQAGIAAQMPAVNAQVAAAITAPALGMVTAPVLSSGATVHNTFNLGGNNIYSQMDEAVFEARVVNAVMRNLSGAGGGLF